MNRKDPMETATVTILKLTSPLCLQFHHFTLQIRYLSITAWPAIGMVVERTLSLGALLLLIKTLTIPF